MGDYFTSIVDPSASQDKAPALAKKVIDFMIGRKIIEPERRDCVLGGDGATHLASALVMPLLAGYLRIHRESLWRLTK